MVSRLHLLLSLLASLPLLALTRSELSVTKCAVKFREYSRIMDKTVKQVDKRVKNLNLMSNKKGKKFMFDATKNLMFGTLGEDIEQPTCDGQVLKDKAAKEVAGLVNVLVECESKIDKNCSSPFVMNIDKIEALDTCSKLAKNFTEAFDKCNWPIKTMSDHCDCLDQINTNNVNSLKKCFDLQASKDVQVKIRACRKAVSECKSAEINSNPWLFVCNKNETLNPTNVATIQRCADSNDLVTACRAVNLDIPDPAAVDEVTIPGLGGSKVTLQSSQDVNPEPDSKTFVSEDGGQAIFTLLTREDGQKQRPLVVHRKASGEVSMLIPVNGRHVLKQLDVNKLKKATANRDTVPWQGSQTKRVVMSDNKLEELFRQGAADLTTPANFTITVYLTKELAEEPNQDIVFMQVKLILADINQGYLNSKIPMTLTLNCVKRSSISEIALEHSAFRMLGEFSNVHSSRDSADAATLMTKYDLLGSSGQVVCGLGYRDSLQAGGTFSVQNRDCSIAVQTLTHELGHHFGADHDIRSKPEGNSQYPYGLGFEAGTGEDAGTVHTLMALFNENRVEAGLPNVAVNYWSSPALSYTGLYAKDLGPLTLGIDGEADNARLLTERRFVMAAIGDESGQCEGSEDALNVEDVVPSTTTTTTTTTTSTTITSTTTTTTTTTTSTSTTCLCPTPITATTITVTTKTATAELQDTIVQDTTVQDTTVQDTTVQDTTLQDTTVQDTTLQDTTVQDTTLQNTTGQDTTVQDTTVQETTVQDTTVQDTTVQDTTVQDTTVQDTTVQDTTVQDPTLQATTVQDTSVLVTTLQDTTVQDTTLQATTVQDTTVLVTGSAEPVRRKRSHMRALMWRP